MRLLWALLLSFFALLARAQVVVTPSGYATLTGTGLPVALSTPLISTPQATFMTVSDSPAGATNATGGLQAGARNSTIGNIPAFVSASASVAEYAQADWQQAWPNQGEIRGPQSAPARRLPLNRGSMHSVSAYSSFPDPVAPMARQIRQREKQPSGVRMFTNEDLERMRQQWDSTTGSRNIPSPAPPATSSNGQDSPDQWLRLP